MYDHARLKVLTAVLLKWSLLECYIWSLCKQLTEILRNSDFSCLWFRASLIYINNCPTRCNELPPSNATKWPRWREVAAPKIWPVPETVVTVLCTLDDGCGWHPKHVEWTCRIINRLLCVASRWTIININRNIFFFTWRQNFCDISKRR